MTVCLFLLVIGSLVIWSMFIGVRGARASRQLTRDEAICREAERSESGLYARWWLV